VNAERRGVSCCVVEFNVNSHCGFSQDVGNEMTFQPLSSSTSKFTDFARLYSTPFQAEPLSSMLPASESVSMIEPCHGAPAPSVTQEDAKTTKRARFSSAYYDLGTGVSKLKYWFAVCLVFIWYTKCLIRSRQGCIATLGKILHLCSSVTKQYNLVLIEGRWRSLAGNVIAVLAESNGSLPPGMT